MELDCKSEPGKMPSGPGPTCSLLTLQGLAGPQPGGVYCTVSEQRRLHGGRKRLRSSLDICSEATEAHLHNLMHPNYGALFFIKRNGNMLLTLGCNVKYT